jgi:tetratricopeptide (TPR) repeat protein
MSGVLNRERGTIAMKLVKESNRLRISTAGTLFLLLVLTGTWFLAGCQTTPDATPYCDQAGAYESQGQYFEAIAEYTKAIETDPKCTAAYFNRGNIYQKWGQFDKAISDYNKAIELDQSNSEFYNNRGNALQRKGQYDQAISDYDKALDIDPKNARAYSNRGVAYHLKGAYDAAWEDVRKAQGLGFQVPEEFLMELRKASGIDG